MRIFTCRSVKAKIDAITVNSSSGSGAGAAAGGSSTQVTAMSASSLQEQDAALLNEQF